MVIYYCSLNSCSKGKFKSKIATAKTVSKRKFNFCSEDHILKLQQINLKKTTESKCKWAVTAYNDWCDARLETFNYDFGIYEADLKNLSKLTKENFQYALCHFIPEVTKQRGEGLYPGKTLYQMVVALQKHLWVNKVNWQLVEGRDFQELKTVLDNIMMERTRANIGVVP